jgi:transaldolase
MKKGYFHRVSALTPTKFWINNVTREEARLAIANGAVGCTQNPSYSWKMLQHPQEGTYALKILQECMEATEDDNEVICLLQRKLVAGVAEIFMPLWESSRGRSGYVSIQGDPIHEHHAQVIIEEGRKNRQISPNIMIKVPATKAGLEAMKVLLEENTPINATEVMSVRQALDLCDLYEQVTEATGQQPVSYLSHIAGIYDEYLQRYVRDNKVEVSRDFLWQAGLTVARKIYRLMRDRASTLGFIAGGARDLHHFTEMVGGNVCVTINWSGTADRLLELDPPVVCRISNAAPDYVVDDLLEKVVEFRRAYLANGLEPEEYESFGPVEYFRSMFVSAWESTLKAVQQRRNR